MCFLPTLVRRIVFGAFILVLASFSVPESVYGQPVQRADTATAIQLISALNNVDSQAQALEREDIEDVRLVRVKKIKEGLSKNELGTLDQALQDAETEGLIEALRNSEVVLRALERTQDEASVEDVVAVDVYGNEGMAVVYYGLNG